MAEHDMEQALVPEKAMIGEKKFQYSGKSVRCTFSFYTKKTKDKLAVLLISFVIHLPHWKWLRKVNPLNTGKLKN